MTRNLAVTLSRLMLRTAHTPLRRVWAFAYSCVTAAALRWLGKQHPGASIFLKGSFATREEVYGVSDVDLVVVLPEAGKKHGAVQLEARERWKQLCRRSPLFAFLVQHCWFYEEDDLNESLSSSCLTYGLASDTVDDCSDQAGFLGHGALCDHAGLQSHPSVYGVRNEWRSARGASRLPHASANDQSRRIAAWLDLQYWWRHAFQACADPTRPHVPLLCVKLLAEPVRLWLLLERGEKVATREAALRRGLSELPEERATLQLGLDLLKALPHSPVPPVATVVTALLRQTERLAAQMDAAASDAGFIEVRLVGGEENRSPSGRLLPLADWRARSVPPGYDENLLLFQSRVIDPSFLAQAAKADAGAVTPAVRHDNLLVLPTINPERGMLRAVQCQATDPVSFAVADGKTTALFPELAGWSAIDCARRAVAEHRGWLSGEGIVYPPHGWIGVQTSRNEPTVTTLGLLFSAARAALFLESTLEGEPSLAVTTAGVAERLIERDPTCRDVVDAALVDFATAKEANSSGPVPVRALCDVVGNLSSYSPRRAFSTVAQ